MKLWGIFFLFLYLFLHVRAAVIRDGFITTKDVHFMLNDSPFYANGFNAYWLMYIASDSSQRDKVSSALQEAANHGLTVGRTWAFSDGGYSPLQYYPGSYNEKMFQVFFPSFIFLIFCMRISWFFILARKGWVIGGFHKGDPGSIPFTSTFLNQSSSYQVCLV